MVCYQYNGNDKRYDITVILCSMTCNVMIAFISLVRLLWNIFMKSKHCWYYRFILTITLMCLHLWFLCRATSWTTLSTVLWRPRIMWSRERTTSQNAKSSKRPTDGWHNYFFFSFFFSFFLLSPTHLSVIPPLSLASICIRSSSSCLHIWLPLYSSCLHVLHTSSVTNFF